MRAFHISCIFGFGICVGLNLCKLVEINENWQASWFTVGISLLMAVVFAVMLEWEK